MASLALSLCPKRKYSVNTPKKPLRTHLGNRIRICYEKGMAKSTSIYLRMVEIGDKLHEIRRSVLHKLPADKHF